MRRALDAAHSEIMLELFRGRYRRIEGHQVPGMSCVFQTCLAEWSANAPHTPFQNSPGLVITLQGGHPTNSRGNTEPAADEMLTLVASSRLDSRNALGLSTSIKFLSYS